MAEEEYLNKQQEYMKKMGILESDLCIYKEEEASFDPDSDWEGEYDE